MAQCDMRRAAIFSGSGAMKRRRWLNPFQRAGIHMRRTGIGRKLALAASVAVMAESPIKSLTDLQDKKLGVQSMGRAGTAFAKAFVKEAGLDPAKDISFLPIGLGAQAVTSVRQKLVDGVIFWDAALAKLAFSGLKLREVPAPERLRTLPDVGLLARTDMIEENPKMLVGIARALAKGYDFSMANPQAAVLITWKSFPDSRSQHPNSAQAIAQS